VVVFEPDPVNFQKCSLLLQTFPTIELYPMALSNVAGELRFSSDMLNPANGQISTFGDLAVMSSTLDAEFPPFSQDNFLIKIDVQGHEVEVLNGGRQLVGSKKHRFFIEFDFATYPLKCLEVWGTFLKNGYSPFALNSLGKWVQITDIPSQRPYCDILFLNERDRILLLNKLL
jgi:FkbM family methyltransferase